VKALISEVRRKAREIADDAYRERLLNALRRATGMNLVEKIAHRLSRVPECLRNQMPQAVQVVAGCVRARNYFVHGSNPKLPLEVVYSLSRFFTDTLEFIFVVSDLADCGWNAERWLNEGTGHSPFHNYLLSYSQNLERLRV